MDPQKTGTTTTSPLPTNNDPITTLSPSHPPPPPAYTLHEPPASGGEKSPPLYLQQGLPRQQRKTYLTATPLASLQQGPAPVDCPVCGVREITSVEFTSGNFTHLSAIACLMIHGLWCIPYLMNAFKDAEHKCGNCGALLAVWHRSGRIEVRQYPTA